MAEPLDAKAIRHVGRLARIELTDGQVALFGRQMAQVLAYVEKLQELDTRQVEPMAHAVDLRNVLADDVPGESLPAAAALANAPDRSGDLYKVPRVIGES